jgi:hypothetical protein
VESSSIVKVVAAFVAGVVVALGSALIYVRASDMRHTPLVSQTAVTVPAPTELPDAGGDVPPPPSAANSSELKPLASERPKVQTVAKPEIERHRVRKRVQIAQNDAKPVFHTPAPPPAMNDPAPAQPAEPQRTYDPQPDQHDGLYVPPAAEPAVVAPPAPPAPEPHVVTLPAGTVLSIRLGETLSTDHNYTGDTFRGTLLAPVIMDGFIIADKGSKILGRVVSAQSAGHMAGVSGLTLALSEIHTTDGQRVQVQTNVYERRGNSNVGQETAKIAGGAALGAIIGAVAGGGKGAAIGAGAGGAAGTGAVLFTHGKPAIVENETPLTFRLANPVTITEKLN